MYLILSKSKTTMTVSSFETPSLVRKQRQEQHPCLVLLETFYSVRAKLYESCIVANMESDGVLIPAEGFKKDCKK